MKIPQFDICHILVQYGFKFQVCAIGNSVSNLSSCQAILEKPGIFHLNFHVLCIFFGCLSRSIIGPKSYGGLGLLLSIWSILQCFNSAGLLEHAASDKIMRAHLLLCVLPLRCVTILCSLSNHFAHSIQ